MATQPIADRLIPVEEYLTTGYEPDCEYRDGLLEERNLGEFDHSFLQGMLVTLFNSQIADWGVFALPEQRVQLRPRRYVVPDLAILRMGTPRERILTRPPLITIEIMSPEDSLRRTTNKAVEYREFGVENIWVIDPETFEAEVHTPEGSTKVADGVLRVPGTPIEVPLEALDRD